MLKKALTLLLVFTGSLQAAVVTQIIDFSTSEIINNGTNIKYSVTDDLFNESFYDINKFDSSLGTLNQIGITILGDVGFSANGKYRDNNWFSDTGGQQSVSGMKWGFYDPFQSYYSVDHLLPSLDDSCSATSGFGDAICTTAIVLPSLDSNLSYGYILDSSRFGAAIGTGTLSLGVRQEGSLTTREYEGEDGFVDSRSADYRSDGKVVVEYHYDVAPTTTTVPAPATAWLFGLALIGLAGIKRKK
jgi:hypothetical protein